MNVTPRASTAISAGCLSSTSLADAGQELIDTTEVEFTSKNDRGLGAVGLDVSP